MSIPNPIRARLAQVQPIKSTIDRDGHSVTLSEDDYHWLRSQIETSLGANERAMEKVREALASGDREYAGSRVSDIGEDIADALGDGSE